MILSILITILLTCLIAMAAFLLLGLSISLIAAAGKATKITFAASIKILPIVAKVFAWMLFFAILTILGFAVYHFIIPLIL